MKEQELCIRYHLELLENSEHTILMYKLKIEIHSEFLYTAMQNYMAQISNNSS